MDDIQIKVLSKQELPSSAPLGTILVCSDFNELYLGNGSNNPITKARDVYFVNNQVELQQTPRIFNSFYVVRYDEAQDLATSVYMWNGGYFSLFVTSKDKTILAYLNMDVDYSPFVSKNEFENKIGDMNKLETINKNTLVDAVNEVNENTMIANVDAGEFY